MKKFPCKIKFASMIYETIYKKETENTGETEENLMDFIKDLQKFPKTIKNYLKNQENFDKDHKKNFFQEKISQNIALSEKLQLLNEEIPKEPKCEQIIEKFLKTQKILEEIYEDFLLEENKQKKSENKAEFSQKKSEKKPEVLHEKSEKKNTEILNEKTKEIEIYSVIQEIKALKNSDSPDIDQSFYCKILKTIANLLNSHEIPQKTDLKQVLLLIKEANELSEFGVLKRNFEFEEKLMKKDEIIERFSNEIQEKNEILSNFSREKDEFQIKINENLKKFERIMKENEKLSIEIDGLREELRENKENSEKNTMRTQKKFDEEKHKELSKKKEKNHEIKEKLKKYEEDFYGKNEENKRLKELKINNENEIKLLRTELNVSQEEK